MQRVLHGSCSWFYIEPFSLYKAAKFDIDHTLELENIHKNGTNKKNQIKLIKSTVFHPDFKYDSARKPIYGDFKSKPLCKKH